MRYAVIDAANNVINTMILDDIGTWQPPVGCIIVASPDAGPGWTYNGTTFVPPPVVPLTSDQQTAAAVQAAKAARQNTFKADQSVIDWLDRLATLTPAQIDNYFAANVTTPAQAIVVLKAVVKYLALKF